MNGDGAAFMTVEGDGMTTDFKCPHVEILITQHMLYTQMHIDGATILRDIDGVFFIDLPVSVAYVDGSIHIEPPLPVGVTGRIWYVFSGVPFMPKKYLN